MIEHLVNLQDHRVKKKKKTDDESQSDQKVLECIDGDNDPP